MFSWAHQTWHLALMTDISLTGWYCIMLGLLMRFRPERWCEGWNFRHWAGEFPVPVPCYQNIAKLCKNHFGRDIFSVVRVAPGADRHIERSASIGLGEKLWGFVWLHWCRLRRESLDMFDANMVQLDVALDHLLNNCSHLRCILLMCRTQAA